MIFYVKEKIGVFGEKRIEITPKDLWLFDGIKSIDMRYTNNLEEIKKFIGEFFKIATDIIKLEKEN